MSLLDVYPKIRRRFDPSEDSGLDCGDEVITKQSFKDECDIRNIIRRMDGGVFPQIMAGNPSFGDFSDAPTYQEALNITIQAQAQFDALGSHVRARFGNDPAQFLAFATDDRNRAQMEEWGLVNKRPVEAPREPQEVIVVEPKGKAPKKGAE